ncbi:MAG: LysM peptidoglycan-binding domain-containing protein, partial [Gallionella sp.]
GRLSLVTPAWRMMLVRNGDFRALVVTETAFAERRLAPDIHRAVPIHLPHNLMYGCYPDAQAVRLILNVEAISVHFEKSLIQKFLPSLSHEMKMMSAQAGPAHDVEPAAALSTEGPELLAARDQASVHQRTDEPAQELDQHAVEEVIGPIGEQEAVAEAHAFTPGAELRVAVLAAEPEASAQDTPSSLDGWSEWNEDGPREQDHLAAADEATENGMAPESAEAGDRSPGGGEPSTGGEYDAAELNDLATASSFSENLLQDLADVSDIEFTESQEPVKEETAELPEPAAPLRHAASRQLSGESINAHGSAVASEKSRVEMAHAPAQKKPAGNDPGQEIPATAYSRAAPARERVKDRLEAKPVGASSKPGALRYRNERTAGAWKRGVAYSAAAAVLLAVLFFVWSFGNTGGENNGGKNVGGERPEAAAQPAKAEQARVQAEQSLMPGKAENAQIETPHPAEMPEARLELDIPKNTPVDADVYVVEKGDTLWSISEHYTGTPLNYPRIAGENRIADPDMIFPGQRIHLRK